MKNNVLIIYWILPITILSCIVCFVANGIMYDLALAIFGSSLLSLIIGTIGYRVEKNKSLERFHLIVMERIKYWDTYDENNSIEEKCNFFMNYYLKDFQDLGTAYADIYFLFNSFSSKKKYITDQIYKKCYSFSNLICNHYWHFKWYLDGSGKNDKAIQDFIDEIENEMLDIKIVGIGKYVQPKITRDLINQLENKYYEIMYGKRQYKKELKMRKYYTESKDDLI